MATRNTAEQTDAHMSEKPQGDEHRRKAQRARSIAIAVALGAFVIILYVATWAKLGANVLSRSL